ncbi:MAG: competence/damage-inducible protein A [Verrucomicrobia bacterium]|nr:competence/damage-inducible protein A [Verrucomicrobiota bacterium]
MTIEIINTGTELMLGSVLNTHQQWLCRELANLGYTVERQVAIPDTGPAIREAVREALSRSDLIITTGGLGPTSDDLTRELIADLLGRALDEDAGILSRIEKFFALRRRPMPDRVRVQALVPEGATVVPNHHGTAPGLLLEIPSGQFRKADRASFLLMLPGPPRELYPMFTEQVVPRLKEILPLEHPFASRTLKTSGLGESMIEEKIAGPLEPLVNRGLEVGYCAKFGEVEVRLAARGAEAEPLIREGEAIVRGLLNKHIFGSGPDQLEGVVIRLLTERNQTLATAESCTGGYISSALTNVSGSSAVFLGGVVSYSNESKQRFLHVNPATLERHGAVSEETAREMAEGIRQQLDTTYGLAVTGIAGPTGGTPEKPVGTVYIALAGPPRTLVLHFLNPYDRATFKFMTSRQALELVRRTVLEA